MKNSDFQKTQTHFWINTWENREPNFWQNSRIREWLMTKTDDFTKPQNRRTQEFWTFFTTVWMKVWPVLEDFTTCKILKRFSQKTQNGFAARPYTKNRSKSLKWPKTVKTQKRVDRISSYTRVFFENDQKSRFLGGPRTSPGPIPMTVFTTPWLQTVLSPTSKILKNTKNDENGDQKVTDFRCRPVY